MYILAIIGTAMLVEGLGEIDKARKKLKLRKNYMFIIDTWPSFKNAFSKIKTI